MSVIHLAIKEILNRKLNFALGLISVVVTAGCLGGASTLLAGFDLYTQAMLDKKRAELEVSMAEMEDEYRKITIKMGLNILILPINQNMSEFYANNFATETMPEEYVNILAASPIITIRHLLPSLQSKIEWPEQKRTMILTGIKDEVPMANKTKKMPVIQPVPEGSIVLGYELHRSLGIEVGQSISLLGREFEVDELYPERGNLDDITAWVPLEDAQELLNKPGRINAILALECSCAMGDLPMVRAEIAKILPDTQVIEKSGQAIARAETRARAAQDAKDAIVRAEQNRRDLRAQYEDFAAILVPLIVAVAAILIGILSWINVRDRREEIGILRAIGVRSGSLVALFLMRAILIGAVGGGVGYLLGWAFGSIWSGQENAKLLFDPALFFLIAGAAPLVSALAGWIPAQMAAQQDPAEILSAD